MARDGFCRVLCLLCLALRRKNMSEKGKTYKSFADLGSPRPGGQQGSSQGGRGSFSGSVSLPKDYMPRRFFDGSGHLLADIFIKWPMEVTDSLAMAKPKATK